ncbi:MAG: hypothetical protein ACLTTU_04670 [Bilophila wadsworthia]
MSERACGVRLPCGPVAAVDGTPCRRVCFPIGVWLFRAVLAGRTHSYDWQWYRVWRYLGRWTTGIIPGPLLDGLA